MSCIEKMSIMGIRSFGTSDRDTQEIRFYTERNKEKTYNPLTLILGHNGTGKTTIIECLRFITTGDNPPNSKGSFVHDPKLANESDVKGQVKLTFRDVEGNIVTAQRSLLAMQKPTKIETKTLENVITRYKANGVKESISNKCADIEREMAAALGVSKAVMNNVIFCHQEDSNWPLGEGKSVKEKFDDIFAATRYIKALENIRSIKKKKMIDIKVMTAEIIYLRSNKDRAIQIAKELEESESRYLATKDKITELDMEINPIEEKLRIISSKEGELNQLKQELGKQETLITEYKRQRSELLKQIQEMFVGTENELTEKIKNFTAQVYKKKGALEEERRKKVRWEQEKNSMSSKLGSYQVQLGQFKTLQSQHLGQISSRSTLISTIAETYSIEGFTRSVENLSEEKVKEFLEKLQRGLNTLQADHDEKKNTFQARENELNSEMEKLRDQRTRSEHSVKLNSKRLLENEDEALAIKNELKRVESSAKRQKEVEAEIQKLEKERSSLESLGDIKALKQELTDLQKEKNTKDKKYRELNQEMTLLQKEGEKRTKLEMLEKEKNYKLETNRRTLLRHEDSILNLLGVSEMPKENLHRKLENLNQDFNEEIASLGDQLGKLKSNLSSLETTKDFHSKELKREEDQLRSDKEKMYNVAGNKDFKEAVEGQQKLLEGLQNEKGSLTGSQYIYGQYIQKLTRKEPCCPLCQRSFEEEQEAQDLQDQLKDKIKRIPDDLKKKEHQISEQQNTLKEMLELGPIQQKIETLTSEVIPGIKVKLSSVISQIEELKNTKEEVEESLALKQSDLKTLSSIQPDIFHLHQQKAEIAKLEKQISAVKAEMGDPDGSYRSLESISDEREELEIKMSSLNNVLEGLHLKVSNYNDRSHALNENINHQKGVLLSIMADQQKRQNLEKGLEKLEKENSELKTQLTELKEEIEHLKVEWTKVKTKRDKLMDEKENSLAKTQAKINELDQQKNNVNVCTKEIKKYLNDGQPLLLTECESKNTQLANKIKTKEEELEELGNTLERLQKDLANQENKERDLLDNLKFKKLETNVEKNEKTSQVIKEKLGSLDTDNLFREQKNLQQKYSELSKTKQQAEGRLREQAVKVKEKRDELQCDMYREADNKYRKMMVELRTSELASDDLEKYYKALDNAVMKFHSVKMDEINTIVRELWMKTYKGCDIDYIEIRSDHTEATTASDRRRVYNYRVIMVNQDISMDMRGRCSAGQKVLASLIIRLALAETFCLNCGVLALDEPTTNLDQENIEGLALSLAEIVGVRSKQKNFQLLVITHDEDFIETLGRTSAVDHCCYRVSKDSGCSRLTKFQIAG